MCQSSYNGLCKLWTFRQHLPPINVTNLCSPATCQCSTFSVSLCSALRLCCRGHQDFRQRDGGAGHAGVQVLQLCCHSEKIRKHTVSHTLNLSVLLCHSLKIPSDTEHSINRQPWCKCITVHEQMRDQGSVCKLWCMAVLNAPLAFSLLLLLPWWGNCLGFLFINQKMKVDLAIFFPSPSLFLFLHFFHAEECVMNELCLCEVAEIHFIVSSMDFCAGRSLMSLHVFLNFVCAWFCLCVCLWEREKQREMGEKESVTWFWWFMCLCLSVCFQLHGMRGQSVGLSVEHSWPHLQRHGPECGWHTHHQTPSG